MNVKKIYLKGTVGCKTYRGHMTVVDATWTFDKYVEISKAEYQAEKASGVPSWGEYETECKRRGIEPQKRTTWWAW